MFRDIKKVSDIKTNTIKFKMAGKVSKPMKLSAVYAITVLNN